MIHQPGQVGVSGRDTFENKNLITRKIKRDLINDFKRNKTSVPGVSVRIRQPGRIGLGGRHKLYWYQSLGLGGSTK